MDLEHWIFEFYLTFGICYLEFCPLNPVWFRLCRVRIQRIYTKWLIAWFTSFPAISIFFRGIRPSESNSRRCYQKVSPENPSWSLRDERTTEDWRVTRTSKKNSLDTISIQIYNPTNFSVKIMFPSRCELREWPVTSTKLVSGLLAFWLFLASFGLTFVGPLPRVAWDEDGEIRAFLLKCFWKSKKNKIRSCYNDKSFRKNTVGFGFMCYGYHYYSFECSCCRTSYRKGILNGKETFSFPKGCLYFLRVLWGSVNNSYY